MITEEALGPTEMNDRETGRTNHRKGRLVPFPEETQRKKRVKNFYGGVG